MSFPVRPPMLLRALPAAAPALLRPEPAEDVTLERPCEALEVAEPTVSLAFDAVLDAAWAASELVEAWRRPMRPTCGLRSSMREAARDMV